MIKANSLLYAIYVCLLVSIICGGLIMYFNLYGQLNLFYNINEELYIQNQSVVNYALGSKLDTKQFEIDTDSGIEKSFESKQFGLLNLLLVKTSSRNDTINSAHFIGSYNLDKTAIYLSSFSKSLSYTGIVKITGDNKLPTAYIDVAYIENKPNRLDLVGKNSISEIQLPKLNPKFISVFEGIKSEKTTLLDLEKLNDSLYYNSFLNQSKEIYLSNSNLNNIIFKGNFILKSKDSIRIKKNCVLEDVILIAPKITFETGFMGNVQAFATNGIELEPKVVLNYPSVICIYNKNIDVESKIKIKSDCKITGAVVLFGNDFSTIDKNNIEIDEKGLIFGDIYCTGKLMLRSNVYGSVFTNKFFLKTNSASYENLITDIEVNTSKKPSYFISIPLFETKNTSYGLLKKVL